MSVLVACECSGHVRNAFRALGFDAWSNDLKPADDGSQFHIQGDCKAVISRQRWSLIIMHPDCTRLAVSGNRWYGIGMPRHQERVECIEWTVDLWELAKKHSDHVALENPVGVLPMPVSQYIHPWEHGHGETKKTGLWLHNLPPIMPTNIVSGRENRIWRMPPSADRKAKRSETYHGIAKAFADQWGAYIRRGIAA